MEGNIRQTDRQTDRDRRTDMQADRHTSGQSEAVRQTKRDFKKYGTCYRQDTVWGGRWGG